MEVSETEQLRNLIGDLEHKLTHALQEQSTAMENELFAYRNLLPYLLLERNSLRERLGGRDDGGD